MIEGTGLACAASGKSGGFLALDWSDGSPLAPLARRSFALSGVVSTPEAIGTQMAKFDLSVHLKGGNLELQHTDCKGTKSVFTGTVTRILEL